jgi:hypothetical protein
MTFLSFTRIAAAALFISLSSVFVIPQFSSAQQRIKFSAPPPPSSGIPGGRGNAGRRGDCDLQHPNFKALVPSPYANQPEEYWGLTTSDRTTIWFDVPTGLKQGSIIEWRLRDAKGKTLQKVSSDNFAKTQPGVIGLAVPGELAIATYQWDIAIFCKKGDAQSASSDPTADNPLIRKGVIQRVAIPAALQTELASAKTPIDRANRYAKYGFWYDALTILGEQLRSTPNNSEIRAAWKELLEQQKLSRASSNTITPCCTFKN